MGIADWFTRVYWGGGRPEATESELGDGLSRIFALSDMTRFGYSDLRNIGAAGVTVKAVTGIPAINRAAHIRAAGVATLRLCCYRGQGSDRTRAKSVWQARLFGRDAMNEYQTRFAFWEALEESLAYRGNGYVWKLLDPSNGRALSLYALHPDQVTVEDDTYTVTVDKGYVDPVGKGPGRYRVEDDTILHIRGPGSGGMRTAPSPIEVFRESLDGPLSRQRHESRIWRRGTSLQQAIVFPEGVTQEKAEAWRSMWADNYEGLNGSTTAVLGAGAELKSIGMTMQDAQFAEMAKLTADDASRIMGVPARFLGRTMDKNVPLEQDLDEWLRFGLGPELERIESALAADEDLFGSSSVYPAFDTDHFVRGDVATEVNSLVALVQAGIITPNEARRLRGLDDIPDGDILQITPVGGAPNPNANAPAVPAPAAAGDDSGY